MRICNLGDGLGQLNHAISDLDEQWAEAKAHWNDDASREFEEMYLRPVPAQMQMLMAAVQALAGTVEKASSELSDRDEEA